ncbi:MAG: hypothetical protein GXO81_04915 [Chlorobi bacterium]|nr:hypothetical protein [Chlorobiota bacterium]
MIKSGSITEQIGIKMILCAFFIFSSIIVCRSQDSSGFIEKHPNVHKVVVDSVLQTTSYTYLLIKENDSLQWIAIPKIEASIGDTYYFQGGMEMTNFRSKELNRVFSSVLFLNGVISSTILEGGKTVLEASPQYSRTKTVKLDSKIEPAKNGITIAELFSNKEKYADKTVIIRGQVTKYNAGIMDRNWIHLQDGSSGSEDLDFTATSQMETKEGDIITIKGKIILNKNFGSGYFFSVIMEDGIIIENNED